MIDLQSATDVIVLEGQPKIAQRFNAGFSSPLNLKSRRDDRVLCRKGLLSLVKFCKAPLSSFQKKKLISKPLHLTLQLFASALFVGLCHFCRTNPFCEFATTNLSMKYRHKESSRHRKRTHFKPNRTHSKGERTHFKAIPNKRSHFKIIWAAGKQPSKPKTIPRDAARRAGVQALACSPKSLFSLHI
jgi:hypothetical protein